MNQRFSSTTVHERRCITEDIVCAVAAEDGVSPLDLQPLSTVIDPDALSDLFRDGRRPTSVEFAYHGYRVRFSGDEGVTVSDANG